MQIGKYYKSIRTMAFYDEADPQSEKGEVWANNEYFFMPLEINQILHRNVNYINVKVLFDGKIKYITIKESRLDSYSFEEIS